MPRLRRRGLAIWALSRVRQREQRGCQPDDISEGNRSPPGSVQRDMIHRVIHPRRLLRVSYVITAVVVVSGGIWAWRALEPPGWHPGFGPRRLAIQVSRGCPDRSPHFDTVANRGGGSGTQLVPSHPLAVLICRYGPGQQGSMLLYRQVRLGAARAVPGARARAGTTTSPGSAGTARARRTGTPPPAGRWT
jgi:hypothetical protein